MLVQGIIAVVTAIVAAFLWERLLRDRLTVRQIEREDDADIEGLLDLYQDLFPNDGTNYSPEEVLELVVGAPAFTDVRHVLAENLVLVAKVHGNVVGFTFCHFYPSALKAIISYYGIDSTNTVAKARGSDAMLRKLARLLKRRQCGYLLFDVQRVDPREPKSDTRRRRGRPAVFKKTAKRLGLGAHQFEFEYLCPKVSVEPDAQEQPCTLMCVPLLASFPPGALPRSQLVDFLRFVLLDCYGDLYPVSDPRHQTYQEYLRQRLQDYEKMLPPEIPLKQ